MAIPTPEQFFAEAERRGVTLSDEQKQKITTRLSGVSIQPQAQPSQIAPVRSPYQIARDEIVGVVEAGANVTSSLGSTLGLAPAMGLAVAIDSFLSGESVSKTVENVRAATEPLIGAAYQPRTQRGQAYTNTFNEIMGGMSMAAEGIAGMNTGPNGTVDPQLLSLRRGMNATLGAENVNNYNLWVLPALVQTGLETIPGAMVGRPGQGAQRLADRRSARERAENVGIQTGFFRSRAQSSEQRLADVKKQVEEVFGRPVNSTDDLDRIAQTMVRLEQENNQIVQGLYEQARVRGRTETPVERTSPIVRVGAAREGDRLPAGALDSDISVLRNYYDRVLGPEGFDFDLELLPVASKRLQRLDEIINSSENRIVKINKLEQWRKGNNTMRQRSGDRAKQENAVISILNTRYDNYMDNLFARDMLTGDRDTIRTWFMARGAMKEHAERFFDKEFVNRVQDLELSASDIKQIVIGASAAGAKAPSIRAVRQLKDELGTGSSEWAALRDSVVYDLMKPLFKDDLRGADVEKFSSGVNRAFDNRKELLEEFFTPEQLTQLRDVQTVMNKMQDLTTKEYKFEIPTFLGKIGFGSGLARAQQRVGLATNVFRRLFELTGDKQRIAYVNAIAGYDVMAPIIPKRTLATTAAIQGGAAQSEAQR